MGTKMSCVKKDNGSNKVSIEPTGNIYHEKQIKEMCALHALNNLLQDGKSFSKTSLDGICTRLSPGNLMNPHRSLLGFGNYDVNVIMAALQTKNYETVWFDKRKDVSILDFENIMGFILNIPTDYKWGFIRLPIHRKHWISVRKINGIYFNLDSKLDAPEIIGKEEDVRNYLKEQMQSKDKELLLVVNGDVERRATWKRQDSKNKDKSSKKETDVSEVNKGQEERENSV